MKLGPKITRDQLSQELPKLEIGGLYLLTLEREVVMGSFAGVGSSLPAKYTPMSEAPVGTVVFNTLFGSITHTLPPSTFEGWQDIDSIYWKMPSDPVIKYIQKIERTI